MIPEVNGLMRAALDYAVMLEEDPFGAGTEAAEAALVRRQKAYTKAVEALVRVQKRHGLKKRPTSATEVGLLILKTMNGILETMNGMYDIMRSDVRPQLRRSAREFLVLMRNRGAYQPSGGRMLVSSSRMTKWIWRRMTGVRSPMGKMRTKRSSRVSELKSKAIEHDLAAFSRRLASPRVAQWSFCLSLARFSVKPQ